jgi:hypothetical protein
MTHGVLIQYAGTVMDTKFLLFLINFKDIYCGSIQAKSCFHFQKEHPLSEHKEKVEIGKAFFVSQS